MGMRITGDTYIWKNENGRYTTTISNKKEDGTYDRVYVQVQFKKGIELENKTKIEIKDGFLSFYKTQDDKTIFKIVVLDFEQEGDAKEPETSYNYTNDLPF